LRKCISKLFTAQQNVLGLNSHEIKQIIGDRPGVTVAIVMDAVMTLLGLETGWSSVLEALLSPNNLMSKIVELDVDSID
jgi:hypothetical protein